MDDITAVRTLIGDEASSAFTDDQITLFNTLANVSGIGSEYFYAASMALNSFAAQVGATLKEVKIGDFSDSSGRNKVTALKASADDYLKKYYETPAWAIAEINMSDLNALIIIRNYVLRTNP